MPFHGLYTPYRDDVDVSLKVNMIEFAALLAVFQVSWYPTTYCVTVTVFALPPDPPTEPDALDTS
jgi:hypothetical protein